MYQVNRASIYFPLVIAAIIHLTVLKYVTIHGIKPDILLVLVVFFALFLGPRYGLEAGVSAGLLKDIFSFDLFGVNAFALGMTGLFIGIINTKFFRESKVTQFLLVLFFSVFSMLIHFILISLICASVSLKIQGYLTVSILPSGLYTALISIPIFSRLTAMYGFKTDSEFL